MCELQTHAEFGGLLKEESKSEGETKTLWFRRRSSAYEKRIGFEGNWSVRSCQRDLGAGLQLHAASKTSAALEHILPFLTLSASTEVVPTLSPSLHPYVPLAR